MNVVCFYILLLAGFFSILAIGGIITDYVFPKVYDYFGIEWNDEE